MSARDTIEFYVGGVSKGGIARVDSSHAPSIGETVVIKNVRYVVTARSYTLDHAGTAHASMSCTIILEQAP